MAFTEALKPKGGSKHLKTIVDAEGRTVEAESRGDEQQKVKYQEIIDLLINAGYYRAKIKGLSEFDKVVGGMTWCIDVCRMDLDVDLLFQENSTIGQKISLTEKIVAVLPKMKCPLMIEPHQIQGLDFIHIHPVIEWLVKKSMENREEHGDYILQYAVHQFNKEYCFPHEKPNENFIRRALPNISAVQDKYRRHRKFRRIETRPSDTFSRVQSTLFEYGYTPTQKDEAEDSQDEGRQFEVVDEVKLKQLTQNMTTVTDDIRLAPKAVTSLVNLQATEIRDAVKNYSVLMSESQVGEKAELRRLKEKEVSLLKEKEVVTSKLNESRATLAELRTKFNNLDANELNLSESEKSLVKQIEMKLLVNNSLIAQENQFKEHCKLEKTRFQALIMELGEDNRSNLETEESVTSLNERVANGRIKLAKISRAETMLLRLIDEVPTRAELAQYQRRFLELYNQVSAKHKETKQFYTLYNTQNDQHQYLSKELSLLNSIFENYNSSLNSLHSKGEFIHQLENIIDGIKHNKLKVEQRRNEEREMKEKLKLQLSSLIEQQRQYATLLKQFTDEFQSNQDLLAEVKKTINKNS